MTTASLLALDASRWSAPKVPSVVQNRVAALPFIPVGEVSYRPVRALLTPERADDRGDAGARAMVGFLALFCTMFAVYLAIGAGQVVGVRRAFAAASRVQQAERAREATERADYLAGVAAEMERARGFSPAVDGGAAGVSEADASE